MSCPCRCHAQPGASCDVDTGSSGVAGLASCSPCDGGPLIENCETCGGTPGNHTPTDDDCPLSHSYTRDKHPPQRSEGLICKWCVNRLEDWLTEITELYATLGTVVEVGSVSIAESEHQKPRKQPGSPSPLRLAAWAMWLGQVNDHVTVTDDKGRVIGQAGAYLGGNLPDVPAVLAGWAAVLYDHLGWGDNTPDTVTGAAAVLRANIEQFAHHPDIDTFDTELRWVRRHLRQAHGVTDPKPLCRCLTIGCKGQVWPDKHGGQPRCSQCRRTYGTIDIYRGKITDEAANQEAG